MKPRLLLVGPVLTASGYGVHARQILKALLDGDRFDVYAESIRWGETAFVLDPSLDWVREILKKGVTERPDVCIEVTIPNEFRRRAPLTIGITAGIEVDRVSPDWIDKCNREIDLVVVPSRHSASGFQVEYQHQNGQKLSLQKPLVVLSEGVDVSAYQPYFDGDEPVDSLLLDELKIPAKCFVSTGLGLDKPEGKDRKNITRLVEWFCRAFKDRQDVGLILKTSIVNGSNIDFETTKKRIGDIKRMATGGTEFPKVYLLHGRISEQDLAAVYNDSRVVAMVSLTHGEGFGLPLIEAAACDLPVIATDWSGHLDFLTKEGKKLFVPVAYELGELPPECVWQGVMDPGTRWANPNEADVVDKMRRMLASSDTPRKWAKELGAHIRERCSLEATGKLVENTIWDAWMQVQARHLVSRDDAIGAMRTSVREKGKSLIYTMPMSAGDVFLSLSVVAALRRKHPDHRVYFATQSQYYDIVRGNPLVDEVIEWLPWMQEVATLEDIFDEVYTPNLAVQMTWSNWIHKGKGRHLLEEFAVQCGVADDIESPSQHLPEKIQGSIEEPGCWIGVHSGGQKSARLYAHWTELVKNIRAAGLQVVQYGAENDSSVGEVDLDLRGKTDHNALINSIAGCDAFIGIDSYPIHVADAVLRNSNIIAIFGSSYPAATGPWNYPGRSKLPILIETKDRHGCDRACYKDTCRVDSGNPCINEIPPRTIYESLAAVLGKDLPEFKPWIPKIGGYIHIFNPKKHGYPFVQSINSMLMFCSEIVVVDGGSTDGSLEELNDTLHFNIKAGRIRIEKRPWDHEEPGMDGMQKAFGRALCSPDMEFLWQQDADEIVHPDDASKVRNLCKLFPGDVDVLHLPVIELWGDDRTCRTDRHSWKWRLTKNNFRVSHGINIHARQMDAKTGRIFARKGQSDGCEYIDIVSGEHLPHRGFYTEELEMLRVKDPKEYGKRMNHIFSQLPSVWHYSWANLPRKVRNFRDFWDGQWNVLYQSSGVPRFPDVKTDDDILKKASELRDRGGEHGPATTFQLERKPPPSMEGWIV